MGTLATVAVGTPAPVVYVVFSLAPVASVRVSAVYYVFFSTFKLYKKELLVLSLILIMAVCVLRVRSCTLSWGFLEEVGCT